MKYVQVNLCKISGISCFGCCGHHFDKNEILESIRKNDVEFRNKKSLKSFMQRNKNLRDSGLCRNLITLKDGSLGCPGHPKQCRRELRTCDILFECKTSYFYNNVWDEEEKKKFLKKIKNMNDIDYSLMMGRDEYLKL